MSALHVKYTLVGQLGLRESEGLWVTALLFPTNKRTLSDDKGSPRWSTPHGQMQTLHVTCWFGQETAVEEQEGC